MRASIHFLTPQCRDFLDHWQELRQGTTLPHTCAFLDSAPARLMPQAFILEGQDDRFLIRFMGTGLVEFWQTDLTGSALVDQAPSEDRAQLDQLALAVVATPCGLWQLGNIQTNQGRSLAYEAVTLPLEVDVDRPARLVSCSVLMDPPGFREYGLHYIPRARRAWIDIGAGIPQLTTEIAP
jgi:hypothetical protein